MSIKLFIEGEEVLSSIAGLKKERINSIVKTICNANNLSGELTIIFCDNEKIRKINKEFRKKNRPTDIISFSYKEAPFPAASESEPLGDIYISLEKAAENAELFGNDLSGEIIRLLIHGILHLAGYDHEKSKTEESKMQKKEKDMLEII